MSLTIATKTYTFDTNPTPDSSKFTGPANTASVKDFVLLKRVAPKQTKDYAGTVRACEKTVKSVVIDGITRDLIAETWYSYPSAADATIVTALRVDHASLAGNACTQTLVDKGTLNY